MHRLSCRYKKLKEAKDISSKSAEDKRAIFGASASSLSTATARSDSTTLDVFQSIKVSVATTEWMEDQDGNEDKRVSKKAKKGKKSNDRNKS